MRLISFILVLIFIKINLYAQESNSVIAQYEQAHRQVVVLKNNGSTIPIQNLTSTRIGFINVSNVPNQLEEKLNLYLTVHPLSESILDHPELIQDNLLLVNIDLASTSASTLVRLSEQLNRLKLPYILILQHGLPYQLPDGYFKSAQSILVSWGYLDDIEIHIAQIIFGASGSESRLPFTINKDYPIGYGIITKDINRLQYGPPELVGLDGAAFKEKLNDAVTDAIQKGVFPGANLLIAKDGIVIYHEAFGKPMYESVTPLKKTDLYDMASITKIFGATLASMVLHSRNLFDPNLTLDTYLPAFKKSNKHQLIWKDILTHRAKLPASIAFYRRTLDSLGAFIPRSLSDHEHRKYKIPIDDHWYIHKRFPKLMMKGIKDAPLLNKEGYVYSDLSMILLYKTVEAISHQPFQQFLDQNLYQSLGADHTVFKPALRFNLDDIVPTERDSFFRHNLVHGYVHDENAAMLGGISGHAGLFSNANDLAKLAQLLLNQGNYGGIQYIKPETVSLYTTYQYAEIGNRRGLGFDKPLLEYDLNLSHVAKEASKESYGHSGFTGTFIWMDPKYQLTYILLTNRVYPSRINNKLGQYSVRPCIQQIIYDFLLNSETESIKPK